MTEFLPQIDTVKCICCELCIILCPNEALGSIDNVVAVINPDACDYVGICQEICPTGAINLVYEIVFTENQ
jgi:Pyruvate/2-oxoacid:ferredoxin oxidoreductase delta subunit